MKRVGLLHLLIIFGAVVHPKYSSAEPTITAEKTPSDSPLNSGSEFARRPTGAETRITVRHSIETAARRSFESSESRITRRPPDVREFFIVPPQIPLLDMPISAFEAIATQLDPLWNQLIVGILLLLMLGGLRRLFPRVPSIRKRIERPQQLLLLHFVLSGAVLVSGLYWQSAHQLLHITSLFVLLMGAIQTITVLLVDIFLERGRRIHIPVILRNLSVVIVYLVGGVIVLSRFGVDLTGILTGSILLTAIVGFSLQDTLGSIASGLAIQLERPYEDGDWIQFGDQFGRVLEINWRSTQLLTLSNETIIIPNKMITADRFVNLSRPEPVIRRRIDVGLPYDAPPNKCKDVLVGAAQHPLVLSDPKPRAMVQDFADHAITYTLFFFIRDIRNQELIDDQVRTNIWYRLKRAGIAIPFPIRNITVRQLSEDDEDRHLERVIKERMAALSKIPFLSPLKAGEREELASGIQPLFYGTGETIIQQGDEGDSLFFIQSGEVEVMIVDSYSGRPRRVALLGAGDFFGEMSLMTGERRAATIRTLTDSEFFVIEASSFREILTEHMEICTQIASILEERQQNLEVKRQEYSTGPIEPILVENDGTVLDRIRHFFGL